MAAKPDLPETSGDPSNTTVHGALIDRTDVEAKSELTPQPQAGPFTADTGVASGSALSQATLGEDSVVVTDVDPNLTRLPVLKVEPTAFQPDVYPETRASLDFPSLTSAELSFQKDEPGTNFMPGQLIFGQYIAKRKLGEGGMGQVWLVNHRELNADRALKLIVSRVSYDTQARSRFRREAQVLARLNHPNAVTVHNARLTDDDVAYIEMEYVPGESLDKIFETGYPMPLPWVARIVDQLCSVLHTAHEQGIVHRDLKPANLMLLEGRPEGEEFLKVLDFGIAKVLEHNTLESELRTGTGMFVGTVAYASPEQLLGSAEPRSDLYSVGVILYEFLTGRRPYLGNANTILQQAVMGKPPAFIEANPSITQYQYPPALEAMVIRCLSKEPNDRPQTARELARLFREAAKIEVAPSIPAAASRSSKSLIAVAVLAIGLSAGFVLWSSRKGIETHLLSNSASPVGFAEAADSKRDEHGEPSIIVPAKLDPAIGLRLMFVRGNTFKMGDGDLAHDETVGDFFLSETEVTNRQILAYFAATGTTPPAKSWSEALQVLRKKLSEKEALDHPAAGVPYELAEKFARWIGGELPTEAEWEFAATCRGIHDRKYPWPYPEKLKRGMNRANIDTLSENETSTAKVKSYPDDKTPEGIYDLAGNVREWCRIKGTSSNQNPVRGGSFVTFAEDYANQKSSLDDATSTANDLGFRVAVPAPHEARLP